MARLVEFMIVGAPKAGTSALGHFLSQHPGIFMPVREFLFFSEDANFAGGERFVEAAYRRAREGQRLGGVDVTALWNPMAAARIRAYNPRMKAVAVLRNPVDRAYSAYWHARRLGWESAGTFEEALENNARGVTVGPVQGQPANYIAQGQYAEQIRRYWDAFGREAVWVRLTEDLRDRPEETVLDLLRWLGVTPDLTGIDVRERVNEGGIPRAQGPLRFLMSGESPLIRLARRALSPRLKEAFFTCVTRPFLAWTAKTGDQYPPMNPDTRARLKAHFEPWNREVAGLLGRDLSAWER